MTTIVVNKAHYPVTALGYGVRVGIWMQGCSIHCAGCVSRDTWAGDLGKRIPLRSLVEWCRRFSEQKLDGVTISGGEPFEQPLALAELLASLREWTKTLSLPVDLLCYSGLRFSVLCKRYEGILSQLDAVIPEPYVYTRPGTPLCGSNNQSVISLSKLGVERYGDSARFVNRKRFQMTVDQGRVWFIGIPERGDMERLEQSCRAKGLVLGPSSWRA